MIDQKDFGLSRLGKVELEGRFLEHYDRGIAKCHNAGFYENRMKVEFRDYLALAQVSGRIDPLDVSFEGTFRLHFLLRARFPLKNSAGEVVVADRAALVLHYPESAVRESLKGTEFVRILGANAFHPNISVADSILPFQALCLGPSVLQATRIRELILTSYGLLTLQSHTMDPLDPAGVLNAEAAEYWQQNCHRIPLSNEPFVLPK